MTVKRMGVTVALHAVVWVGGSVTTMARVVDAEADGAATATVMAGTDHAPATTIDRREIPRWLEEASPADSGDVGVGVMSAPIGRRKDGRALSPRQVMHPRPSSTSTLRY